MPASDCSISQPSNLEGVLTSTFPNQEGQRQPEQRAIEILSSLSYRTGELKVYLQRVAQGVNDLIGLDWSVVTLCQNEVEQILASTIALDDAAEQSYSLHGTLTGTVVKSGCPLVVENTNVNVAFGKAPEGYQAYLGVPLRTPDGEVIGTICSFQMQPRQFTAEDVELAELFAERAATAIDNYQLYQQQQKFNQALEAEVVHRTQELQTAQSQLIEANEQLEQRIEQRTAELQHINRQLQVEIQERQQVEEALRQSEIRFRILVENAADIFLLVDPTDGRILDANRQACEDLGYKHQEILALTIPDLDVKLTASDLSTFCQHLVVGMPATLESEHRRKNGTTFLVEANICLFEAEGRLLSLFLVRDITERKQAEQAMARLAEIGELAAMIVHEVRNPLTTVLMGLTALRGADLSEKDQLRLALALEDAERLQRLLNEILLYAKQQVLQCDRIELNAFITDLLAPLQNISGLAEREIQFVSLVQSVWMLGDRDKLKQIFINLIRNACEAVEPGETITWRLEPGADANQFCVSIHNNGAPIPSEVLAKLGTPFFTTKPSGNGLGLAIVRRIIEAHSGKFSIQSEVGMGTIVKIHFPLAQFAD
jgi:PAS domain S-box-containing protein